MSSIHSSETRLLYLLSKINNCCPSPSIYPRNRHSSFIYPWENHNCLHSSSCHTISVLYCAHLFMKCFLGISNFLEEFSNLTHSIVPLFLCIDHWGRLSYLPCYSLEPLAYSKKSLLTSAVVHLFSWVRWFFWRHQLRAYQFLALRRTNFHFPFP